MLEVNNIEVTYVEVILVLRGVSIEVPGGQIVCLLGANGAGKTTTLKAISGLLKSEEGKITDGSIFFEGRRIDKMTAQDIVKMGISQVMEGRRTFKHLTVEENILVGGHIRRGAGLRKDLETMYGYFPILKGLRHRICGYCSGGEQQMILIAQALMSQPKLVLLDEPSLGLAPIIVEEIFEIIRRINKEQKVSILLVEQNAQIALASSDYGYVMENGRIVLDGPSAKLAQNEDVQEFYMGLSRVGAHKSYRDVKHYKRRKRWLS